MTRVKRGTISMKRRRNILSRVKGFRFGRSTKERQANEALSHAGAYAFAHRRAKKRDFRRLWTVQINASVRELGTTYSKLIDAMNKKGMTINRKMLAHLAEHQKETFEVVVKEAIS